MSKSVYKYAAEAGLPIGIYLIGMSACVLFSLSMPALPMLVPLLALGFPVLLGYYMKRLAKACPSYGKFSALWLFGIYSVIFGTLICSLFSALYLVVINPGFIASYVSTTLSTIEASPVAAEYVDMTTVMRSALESRRLPSGMQFVTTIGWFSCFVGSMLSMLLAGILSASKKRKTADMFR